MRRHAASKRPRNLEKSKQRIPLGKIGIVGVLVVISMQMLLVRPPQSAFEELDRDFVRTLEASKGSKSFHQPQQQPHGDIPPVARALDAEKASTSKHSLQQIRVFSHRGVLFNSDEIFDQLVQEANHSIAFSNNSKSLKFMEVGVHSPQQCAKAARAGMMSHCIEASPKSRERIVDGIRNLPEEFRQNVRFYQLAASKTSFQNLEFSSHGGTGDHIGGGGIDMFRMIKSPPQELDNSNNNNNNVVTVQSVAIDDMILRNQIRPTIDYQKSVTGTQSSQDPIDQLYLLKVDVQAHEPEVFAGLHESLQQHKIDLLLFEYWPKGMDFLKDALGTNQECQVPVQMLETLANANYTLYSLVSHSHPVAPMDEARKLVMQYNRGQLVDHLQSLQDHCRWYYELETKRDCQSDGTFYEMGYWTDILAVRPGFGLENPITKVGKYLASRG